MKKSAYTHSALIQNRQFRTRNARKECGHSNELRRKDIFRASPITARELSVTRLPHLSGICFIDDHESLVAGFPLRFSAKQLVPQKSRAFYIFL